MLNGKFLNSMLTCSGVYASSICLTAGIALEQNGHWKSEYSVICTFDFSLPYMNSEPAGAVVVAELASSLLFSLHPENPHVAKENIIIAAITITAPIIM